MRFGRIAAQEKQRLGIANIGVAVGHRAVAPGVGYARDRGRMADARLMVRIVGSPKRGKFAIEIGPFIRELGGAQPVDGIRARLAANFHQLVADFIDGGIPGNLVPLAVDQLHWIFQAAVAMHDLARRSTLGAMRAAVDRAIPGRLLADPHAVLDFGEHGAADRAMRADVFADSGTRTGRRSGGLGVAYAGQRQRADGGKSACSEARAAQERAAIEIAACLVCKRGGKGAVACLTFGSFDQHGRLLMPGIC
jgi:hypothetical protein